MSIRSWLKEKAAELKEKRPHPIRFAVKKAKAEWEKHA